MQDTSERRIPLEDKAPLKAWLCERLPDAGALEISDPRTPGAGESSDTQLFEIEYDEGGDRRRIDVVLRREPVEGPFPEYDIPMQFHVMQALAGSGCPVPEVLWLEEDPAVLGRPFLVMRQVIGEAPLDFPPYQGSGFYHEASPAQRAHMWDGTVAALAQLHDVDWKTRLAGKVPGAGAGDDPALASLRYWRHYLETFIKTQPDERVPVFDDVLRWLEENRPEPERLSLCWGDAKLGNVMFAHETHDVAAVIDWEMAIIGDPENDLASLHLSDLRAQDGAEGACLPGTPGPEALVALYERHSGRRVRHFHFALVFATFWRGSVQIAWMRRLKAKGNDIPDAMFVDNFPVRTLCRLLEWDPPTVPG